MSGKSGREQVLGAIRGALGSSAGREADLPVIPKKHGKDPDRFLAALKRASASHECLASKTEVPQAVARFCKETGLGTNIAVSPSLPEMDWKDAGISTRKEWSDDLSLAVTGCRAALSETGQIAVDNGSDDAWLSLVAPVHVAVVEELPDLRGGLDDLAGIVGGQPPTHITLIHGPSRTGDVEQTLVLGAHGPGKVHVLFVKARPVADA